MDLQHFRSMSSGNTNRKQKKIGGTKNIRTTRKGLITLDSPELEEILSSKKRHHYNRALKEMHELVKLESLSMQWSGSGSDEDQETERQENEMMTEEISGK